MVPTPLNPFVPGRGAVPPYLAGREVEQRTLRRILAYVQAGRGAPRDVVLCGPRGNGKTVLLRWFQREVEALDQSIEVVWRTPSDLPSVDALATSLAPPGRFKAILPDSLSLSIGIGRVGWELGDNPGTFAELLTLRCRQRSLVVLLDEAHTLDPVVGQALLNASQSVSSQAPFLLVLAGTPGLEPQLNAMSATFWDRAEQLGIGLLDRAASADALKRPFECETPPLVFDPAALASAVEASQCYPYFLQLLGAAIWDAATGDQTMIGPAVVAQATTAFHKSRATCYHHRRNELDREGLLDVAGALAGAFKSRETMTQAEIDHAIVAARRNLDRPRRSPPAPPAAEYRNEAIRIRDGLAAVGYVWNPPGEQDLWRPGIPSLMAHIGSVAAQAPPRQQ